MSNDLNLPADVLQFVVQGVVNTAIRLIPGMDESLILFRSGTPDGMDGLKFALLHVRSALVPTGD
ncbi:MAG: hypothetical protein Fues2KO_48980 [Fuerstiella sp.]